MLAAYYNHGSTYSNLGQYSHAIEDYDQAIRFNPKSAVVYYDRGNVYSRRLAQFYSAVDTTTGTGHSLPM